MQFTQTWFRISSLQADDSWSVTDISREVGPESGKKYGREKKNYEDQIKRKVGYV